MPLTLPSHVTIMTGLLPVAHGVRDNGVVFAPQPSAPTLARRLQDAGYRTGAFVGAYVLDRRFGLADGFDSYDDRIRRNPDEGARLEAERRGGDVVDARCRLAEPVHVSRSSCGCTSTIRMRRTNLRPGMRKKRTAMRTTARSPTRMRRSRGSSRFSARAERRHRRSSAVAGDHGEGLGEHGEQTHGMLAYDSTLRVPLVLSGASIQPRVVSTPVSLVDLAPTLLRLAKGASASPGAADLLSTTATERDVYAETQYPRIAGWHPLSVLAGERWKLVRSSEVELYDLSGDPSELHNVASANAGVVQGMTKQLGELQSVTPAAPAAVAAEASERLRALGYVSGSSAPAVGVDPRAPNPARVIGNWSAFEGALSTVNAGRPRDALATLKPRSRASFQTRRCSRPHTAARLKDAGRPAEAVAVYRQAVTRIRDASLYHDLAVAARAAGNLPEALKAEQAALALNGRSPEALNGLGLLHAEAGRETDAAAAFEQATALDPSNAAYWTNLGNARRASGDFGRAEAAYRRALEVDATYADAANGLGTILVQTGKPADAVQWFERAIQQAPDFYEARLNLGIALQESGQRDARRPGLPRDPCQGTGSLQTRERSRGTIARAKKIDRRRCSVSCLLLAAVLPLPRSAVRL